MNLLKKHFKRYTEREPWDFCWRLAVESVVASLVAAVVVCTILGVHKRDFLDWPMAAAFIMLVLVAPPVETLLFQAPPIFVARACKGSLRTQIAVSTIIFAALHFLEGVGPGVSAGIVGGLYFAFAYAFWRTKSRWKALWVTTVCHAIHNLFAFVMLVIGGNWA